MLHYLNIILMNIFSPVCVILYSLCCPCPTPIFHFYFYCDTFLFCHYTITMCPFLARPSPCVHITVFRWNYITFLCFGRERTRLHSDRLFKTHKDFVDNIGLILLSLTEDIPAALMAFNLVI